MSVVTFAIERIQGGQNASGEFTADDTTFTRRFKVIVNSDTDEAQLIYSDPQCPKIGDYYQQGGAINTASRVTNVRINPLGGRYADASGPSPVGTFAWSVEVSYSRKGETVENPLLRRALVYYDMEQYDAPLDRDLDGKAVLNSAAQPFDPPCLKEDNRIIVRVEKNLPSFNAGVAAAFENAVNSAIFLGFAAKTLRITKITGSPQEDAAYGTYYATSTEMQFRPVEYTGHEPHQANILDMGRYELDTSNPDLWVPILDKDGQPVVDSVPLNGFGKRKPRADPPYYHKYRRYVMRDFASLGIYP